MNLDLKILRQLGREQACIVVHSAKDIPLAREEAEALFERGEIDFRVSVQVEPKVIGKGEEPAVVSRDRLAGVRVRAHRRAAEKATAAKSKE